MRPAINKADKNKEKSLTQPLSPTPLGSIPEPGYGVHACADKPANPKPSSTLS